MCPPAHRKTETLLSREREGEKLTGTPVSDIGERL
jgi:hypothetical protein